MCVVVDLRESWPLADVEMPALSYGYGQWGKVELGPDLSYDASSPLLVVVVVAQGPSSPAAFEEQHQVVGP